MKRFTFSVSITPESWADFYRQPRSTVVATTQNGQRVKFAAKHLQRHVTRDGVQGIFVLTIDGKNDFVSLERHR